MGALLGFGALLLAGAGLTLAMVARANGRTAVVAKDCSYWSRGVRNGPEVKPFMFTRHLL